MNNNYVIGIFNWEGVINRFFGCFLPERGIAKQNALKGVTFRDQS